MEAYVTEEQRKMVYALSSRSAADVRAYQHIITEYIILRVTRKNQTIVFAVDQHGYVNWMTLPSGQTYELYIKWYWINRDKRIGEHRPMQCVACSHGGLIYMTGDSNTTRYSCHKCGPLGRMLISFFSKG